MMDRTSEQHALGVDGLMEVIRQLYTPEYIVMQNYGENAGHYAVVVSIDGGETLAAVDLGDYRSGNQAVSGENGYYNVLITAFNSDQEYINNNIFDERNDVIYDKSTDKKYEAPEHVALGDTPVGLATETSSDNSIRASSEKSNKKIQD